MSSYLARLALRALGRPVDTRLMPRIDPMAAFAPGIDADDAASSVQEVAPSVPLRSEGERRDRRATLSEPAAASVRRSPIPDAAPSEHPRSAPVADPPPSSARARSRLAAALVESSPSSPAVVHAVHAMRADAPASAPPELTSPAARARSSSPATHEPPVEHAVRRVVDAAAPRRARELREPGHRDESASSAARTLRETRLVIDTRATPPAAAQAAAAAEARAGAEPAAISVEIGRIEVRVAPPPAAPASRPRAAAEGFAGYWRVRNYLDRPR